MNELENARRVINDTDKKMAELFTVRMKAAEAIAAFKSTLTMLINASGTGNDRRNIPIALIKQKIVTLDKVDVIE